jgi:light-regulated signal transduction histidine kinase (bacteriophytochrome)
MMEMSNEEVLSRVHPDDLPALLSELSQLNQMGKGISEYRFQGKDGNYRWWSNQMVISRDPDCKPLYRDGFVRDVTELKLSEEKLKNTMAELKRSNQELEQFAYVASHDLQEPLRMVASFSQLLEQRYKDRLDDDAHEFIGFIVEGSQRMKCLIDDLLTFSRVTSQAKEFERVDLESVLDVVISNLSISIKETNAVITHETLPKVFADPSQMRQVFQNLIANALKFQVQNTPEIHISAQKDEKEWTFSIKDNGIGINPQYHEQIFEVFKRLHTRLEYPGTGIGLAICQKIIQRHGGHIWVESEPGKGSNFYFTIPLK